MFERMGDVAEAVWRPDPEIDAIHARSAVLVTDAEQLPAGPLLAAALVRLQGLMMDCTTAMRATACWDRLTAWSQAQAMVTCRESMQARDLPTFFDAADAAQIVAQDLAVLTHVSYGSARGRVELVGRVARHLPAAWVALDQGRWSLAHVQRLARELEFCPGELAEAVEGRVVPEALRRGWTPAQLARAVRRAVIAADPDGAADRAEAAKAGADVQLFPGHDETATLIASGDALTLHAVIDVIDAGAKELADGGDLRPVAQRRFTALARLILNNGDLTRPARPKTEVLVTVDLTTLLGVTATPGEITGYGPISPATARLIAADATLRRLVTDPVTGVMVDLGRSAYRPTARLRRIITARDRTCRFPGCSRPARHCDVDHDHDWFYGGITATCNLQCLCRMHHQLKTRGFWRSKILPDGMTLWTSPLGFTYRQPPACYPTNTDPPDAQAA